MEAEETKQIIDKFLNSNEESNNYFNNKSSYHYFDANYPDCILVKVEKGGSSGGNCWNDDPSEPYEKETYEIEQEIFSEVKYRIYQLTEDLNINLKTEVFFLVPLEVLKFMKNHRMNIMVIIQLMQFMQLKLKMF